MAIQAMASRTRLPRDDQGQDGGQRQAQPAEEAILAWVAVQVVAAVADHDGADERDEGEHDRRQGVDMHDRVAKAVPAEADGGPADEHGPLPAARARAAAVSAAPSHSAVAAIGRQGGEQACDGSRRGAR